MEDIDAKQVARKVRQIYQALGLSVTKRAIGYGLEQYDFADTIDDGDIRLMLLVAHKLDVKRAFVVGNAWGWGAFCTATVFPDAEVTVIDAECEGLDVAYGSEITRKIAKRFGMNVHLSRLKSPEEVPIAVENHRYDFVLINGKHGDMQIIEDFLAISPYLRPRCMVMLPTVGKNALERGCGIIQMAAKQLGFNFFEPCCEATPAGTALVGRKVNINPGQAKEVALKVL